MKRAIWKTAATLTVVLGTSIGAGISCSKNNPPPTAPPAQAAQPASKPMHSVQVRQLKPLMQVILHTTSTNWPKTLPTDVEQPIDPAAQQKAYDQAVILADGLIIAAGQIPGTVGGKSLPEDYRAGFLAEAKLLKNHAEQLRVNATQKRAESMSRNLDAINVSCINCHSKYRDLTGNLDPLRARSHDADTNSTHVLFTE